MTSFNENARRRWAINCVTWEPSDIEFRFLLGILPGQERGGVVRYRKEDDRKRSLLSKLMQRRVASLVLGVPFTEVEIRRTKGRKPYAVAPHGNPSHAPNFNFNVSHEGDWVVLASEGRLLCGVDVAAPEELRSKQVRSWQSFRTCFESQLTPLEWLAVEDATCDSERRVRFQSFWSLKEAFVKARGDGLGFPLSLCEFHPLPRGRWPPKEAYVRIASEEKGIGSERERGAARDERGARTGGSSSATNCDSRRTTTTSDSRSGNRSGGSSDSEGDEMGSRDGGASSSSSSEGGYDGWGNACSDMDGMCQNWCFHVSTLPGGHVVSVALGPPQECVDAWRGFQSTFSEPWIDASLVAPLARERVPFSILTVGDMLPEELLGAYEDAGGEVFV